VEGEMTITRLADDHFYLVSAAVGELKDREHFDSHTPPDADVELTTVSADIGVLVLAGPRSRELLARCTDASLDNEAFPWLTWQPVEVCGVELRALRVGFTGELGWELHLPIEHMLDVYDGCWAAGHDLGVADVGNHALNSLRMEKAYRISRDMTHDVDPVEAGLDFFVKRDKGDFVGRDALLARDARPRRWASTYLAVDTSVIDGKGADCIGGEGVFDGSDAVGLVSTGGYGYSTGSGYAFAWLDPSRSEPGTRLEVLVVGQRCCATVLGQAAYDPRNERLKM
ncbi:MAG: aminomethyltransferase family protein, partial [Acidimicrobiia bacterium]|nr:aminomethyltransferase family protein [Acidimicrobiia bacterium]